MSPLLSAVDERVRVSLRVSASLEQRIRDEVFRRRQSGDLGGRSLAELTALAVAELAALDTEGLRRAYRRALPVAREGSAVHLQPRINAELAEYVEVAAEVLRGRLGEREASRGKVLVTAFCELLPNR